MTQQFVLFEEIYSSFANIGVAVSPVISIIVHEIFCKVFLVYFGKAGVDFFKQHKLLCHIGLLLGLQL